MPEITQYYAFWLILGALIGGFLAYNIGYPNGYCDAKKEKR